MAIKLLMKSQNQLRSKIPFLIVLLQIFFGVSIAIFFGVNEHFFKDRINAELKSHPKMMTLTKDPSLAGEQKMNAFLKKESSKNWRYYQRFHFHSTGIAAMSLGLLLLLHFLIVPGVQKLVAAYLVSVGGFLYPFLWLFAAIYGPSLGRGVAKEQFVIFGYMGGVFMLGVLFTIYLTAKYPLQTKS